MKEIRFDHVLGECVTLNVVVYQFEEAGFLPTTNVEEVTHEGKSFDIDNLGMWGYGNTIIWHDLERIFILKALELIDEGEGE